MTPKRRMASSMNGRIRLGQGCTRDVAEFRLGAFLGALDTAANGEGVALNEKGIRGA